MRKCGWKTALVLFLLFLLPFFNPTAEGGTGSIRAKIVLPGDTGATNATIPLSIGLRPMSMRPLEGGDGGGGDGGGGSGGDGGGGGDGGYSDIPWNPIAPVTISEDRILKLENLNAGLYNLILQYGRDSKDEYQLALKNIRVVEGQVTDLKDLLMKRGGTITGSVKYAGRTDFPTATVHVVGFAGTNASTLPTWLNNRTITATDLTGNFTLTNLPEGTYTLAITPGGDAAATHAREIINNVRAVADQTISATPFGPFELSAMMGILSGWVGLFDRPSGPYDSTLVRATSSDGRFRSYIQATDANGYYDFGKIPIGNYRLYIQHPGYKVSESDITLSSSGSTQADLWLRSGMKKICGNVALPGGGQRGDLNSDKKVGIADAVLALQTTTHLNAISPSLTGEVNNDGKIGLAEAIYALQIASELRLPSGSSLSGTLVMIPGTSLMAVTDAAGNFIIEKVPEKTPGNWTYDLFITREGYQAIRQENVTAQDISTACSLAFTLLPHETVTVGGKVVSKGSIVGRAWLKKSTDDYRSIDIAIENTGIPIAKPNAFGNFFFADVPPGRYTLNYTKEGYKTVAEAGVLVAPDLTTETRNVVLIPRNGTIKGQVTLEGAQTCGGVQIRVEPSEAQIASFQTDAYCNFSISVPENYNVLTNQKCVLNGATGGCTGSPSYTVVAGDQALEELGYKPHTFANVNVPAGETVDLGTVKLKKPPPPPTGVTAAQKDGSSVTVSWTASLSTDVAGYTVYYGTRSDQIDQRSSCQPVLADAVNKVWQCTVAPMSKGVTYYLLVKAIDGSQLESIASQHVVAEIIPLPIGSTGEIMNSKISYDGAFVYPTDVAVSRDNLRAYVTNAGANLISVLDLSSYSIKGYYRYTYSGSSEGRSLVSNPLRPEVYVLADTASNNTSLFIIPTVDEIGPDRPQLLINPSLSGFIFARRAIVSPDGRYLFISQQGDSAANWDKIFVIDLDTKMKVAGLENGITLNTSTTNRIGPLGMAIANNKLYVANENTTYVSIVDINPGSPTAWQKLTDYIGDLNSPQDVSVSNDGRYIYIANSYANLYGDDEVVVYDTTSKSIVKRIPVKNFPNRLGMSGDILFVLHDGLSTVVMINTKTNEALGTTFTTDGTGPKSIAFTYDGQKILITDKFDDSLTIRQY